MSTSKLSQTNVVVTGAYGFVGRHVARAVAKRGYRVTGIGHGAWGRDEWIQWGISDWHLSDVTVDSLITYAGEPDIIFHCAGSGSVGFSMSHPYQDYQRTVTTVHSVLEYIRVTRPQCLLVLPSSAAVYGRIETLPVNINAPLHPVSPYGVHKKVAEDLCRSYGQYFGVASAIVRLFSIYGIGLRKQLLWDGCAKILAGDYLFSGTGSETRDWLHIEDAAELLIVAADNASKESPIVNGGTGQGLSIANVLKDVSRGLNLDAKLQFSGITRPGDPIHYAADITEAIGWGWKPRKKWSEQIDAYVKWFKMSGG